MTEANPIDQTREETSPQLPSDALIILPMRNAVLFPGHVSPFAIGRPASVAGAQQAVREQRQVGILMQRRPDVAEPTPSDMHQIGVAANIMRFITTPDGAHHLVCHGEARFRVLEFLDGWPFLVARVLRIPKSEATSPEIEARFLHLKSQASEALQLLPQAPEELLGLVQSITSPSALADLAATYMDFKPEEKQEILETIDVAARMDKVSRLLERRLEVLRLSQEIGRQTKAALDERQREVLLREQMAAIQRQLGEGEGAKAEEIAELEEAIAEAEHAEGGRRPGAEGAAPPAAHARGRRRIRHDAHLSRLADRAAVERCREAAPIDIAEARRILDEDHYGLEKIKSRILEYLAVRKLEPEGKAPILCFVGPPGRRQDLARPVASPAPWAASSCA